MLRGKQQTFEVNKARITVSSCLSVIFEINKTTKILTVKPTINFKSPFGCKELQTCCFTKFLGAINKQP